MNGSFPEEGRVGNGAREEPVMQKKGDIHDKFCQGENGDFPLTFRIDGLPVVF